jgi:hypothetical protein
MAENSDSDCESDNEEDEELQFIRTYLLSRFFPTHLYLILL